MAARILVTGGSGFIGAQVVERLGSEPQVERVVSVDVRAGADGPHVHNVEMDVRDPALADLVTEEKIDRMVHLAAVVTPRPDHTRDFLRSVDVDGSANVVAAALRGAIDHLTVTSSGAVYGYHPDNLDWIDESTPLRGNPEFAYSDHKRLVEEDLADVRRQHPELGQLILRPGTILGSTVDNQITRLFDMPVVLGVMGSDSPFVFIWESDVVEIIVRGTLGRRTGIFNVAGSGAVPMRQVAKELGKPFVPIPAMVLRGGLAALRRLGAVAYGPEQVSFLRYRPVLSNRRLVEEFGYTPQMSSLEAFRAFLAQRS